MSQEDRTKWNDRYSRSDFASEAPSSILLGIADLIPTSGRALDVAGGGGRHSVWLAKHGLDVTLADISAAGIERAQSAAKKAGVNLETACLDFDVEPLPPGPWDVILCVRFICRPLFKVFPDLLSSKGLLVVLHPTKTNLTRHEKPPLGFLLEDGELPKLASNLDIVLYEEGWLAEGRHEALMVARRPRH